MRRAPLLLALISLSGWGFVPEAGQALRFQPQLLRQEKPFSVKGTLQYRAYKMETWLEWLGPTEYKILLREIPDGLYASGEGAASWALIRKGRACVFKTDRLTTSCPPSEFWPLLHLSAQPEEALTSLVAHGFLSSEAALYRETDSRNDPIAPSSASTRPALGYNGKTPLAVIEVRGPQYEEQKFSSEGPSWGQPVLHLDPTFLTVTYARWTHEGRSYFIRALSDLSLAPRKSRWTWLLPSRLEVGYGETPLLTVLREEPKPFKGEGSLKTPSQTLTDLSTLRERLSVEGQEFLELFLLTH